MKAVVVELNNTKAAVLSDDGCITTIKNNNYEIGQVIQLNQPKVSMIKKISVCAASAAAVIFISTGTWAYASPYSYVSMDVNPSIEFSVNRFDRVIKVKAVNDDGEEILKQISLDDLTNQTIEKAITATVKEISEAGYFDGETEGGIVIATSSEDMEKAEELAQELQESVTEETTGNGDVVMVESISVGMERVDEAKSLGVTPGKLGLVEKLQEAADDSSSINLEEWLSKPVKDIMKATKEFTKANTIQEDAEASDNINENENSIVQNSDETTDNQINEDKALKQAEKDAEKAQKEAAKAEKKAKEAKEKADKKAKEAAKAEDAEANNTGKDAKGQSITKAQEAKEAAKEAQKDAEEARKEAEKARKDAEKAQKEVEKAQKEAEKGKKKPEQNKESNHDSKRNDNNTIDDENNSKKQSSDNITDQNNKKKDDNQVKTDPDSTKAPNKENGNSGNSDKGKN